VQYRRALQPAVFSTEWSYVDHLLIPPGSVVGPDAKADIAELYYVLAGDGTVKVGSDSAEIHTGDGIPIHLGESKSFAATGNGPLEVMIIGVAKDMAAKDLLWATQSPH
jgi:mannose-6-phosphate isomerase-like protein (cupin superfamily)